MPVFPSESILSDLDPVYPGTFYVVDGEVTRLFTHSSVAAAKRVLRAREIRRCDLAARAKALAASSSVSMELVSRTGEPMPSG
jgi:hypothetical protein